VPALLDALDRMPRALCHFDVHPANLFGDEDGPTIAIDWSFVGIGAIGEDVGNLVPDAVLDFHIAPDRIDELYERLVRGYTDGLRAAGWRGPDSLPRAAMAMTIAAKYAWIAPEVENALAEQREMLNRRPLNETLKWWEPAVVFIAERIREAHALLGSL
jgi:thiamine kinase-like enzyme